LASKEAKREPQKWECNTAMPPKCPTGDDLDGITEHDV